MRCTWAAAPAIRWEQLVAVLTRWCTTAAKFRVGYFSTLFQPKCSPARCALPRPACLRSQDRHGQLPNPTAVSDTIRGICCDAELLRRRHLRRRAALLPGLWHARQLPRSHAGKVPALVMGGPGHAPHSHPSGSCQASCIDPLHACQPMRTMHPARGDPAPQICSRRSRVCRRA